MLAVPVLTSLAGRGIIPDDHPMSVGGLGAHRNPLSKEMFLSADVIVGIGTKLEEMETNWRDGFLPDPRALYVQIDYRSRGARSFDHTAISDHRRRQDRAEADPLDRCGKRKGARCQGLHGARAVARICKAMAAVEAEAEKIATQRRVPIHALLVIRAARNTFPRETTIGVDVGCLAQQIAGAMPYFRVYEPRSLVVPSSFYGMGFVASGFPVAKLVYPDRPALCFVGDGSFQMVMNNLPTAVEHNLPVTWCVLNDEAYGSIRDIQTYVYGQSYLGTDLHVQPDFTKIAEANGCYGERIEASQDIAGALARALDANKKGKPAVLDFAVGNHRMVQSTEFFHLFPRRNAGLKLIRRLLKLKLSCCGGHSHPVLPDMPRSLASRRADVYLTGDLTWRSARNLSRSFTCSFDSRRPSLERRQMTSLTSSAHSSRIR